MKPYRNLIHLAVAVVVLSLVGIQDADAARRASLSGNLLIEDRDDVFLWPQLAVNHANLAAFEYGPVSQAGNGLLLMGNERAAFGVAIHRGDIFDNQLFPHNGFGPTGALLDLVDPTVPLAGVIGVESGTIVDLFAGFDIGAGLAGARLAIGSGGSSTTPADPDADEVSDSVTFVMLQAGYSLSGPLVLDTALRFHLLSGSQERGDDTPLEGTNWGMGLKARGYADIGQPFELGFLGDILYNNESIDRTAGGQTISSSENTFAIQAGAGPVWEVGADEEDTIIAAYGVLGFMGSGEDLDTDQDDNATGESSWILPGFNLAADIELLDWLYFRSGAQYLWAIEGTSQEFAGQPDDLEESEHGPGGFGWTAGFGIETGNFRFDGTFAENFLTSGPNFIGGGSGFLTMASAEYQWE